MNVIKQMNMTMGGNTKANSCKFKPLLLMFLKCYNLYENTFTFECVSYRNQSIDLHSMIFSNFCKLLGICNFSTIFYWKLFQNRLIDLFDKQILKSSSIWICIQTWDLLQFMPLSYFLNMHVNICFFQPYPAWSTFTPKSIPLYIMNDIWRRDLANR